MDTEQMIRELRYLEERYKDRTYSTFETNWYCLCRDVADRLEELNEELKTLKSKTLRIDDAFAVSTGRRLWAYYIHSVIKELRTVEKTIG